jgi:hypothetical protein
MSQFDEVPALVAPLPPFVLSQMQNSIQLLIL